MKRTTIIILVFLAALLFSTGCETIREEKPTRYQGVDPYKGPSA
jgi:hypothetical protein